MHPGVHRSPRRRDVRRVSVALGLVAVALWTGQAGAEPEDGVHLHVRLMETKGDLIAMGGLTFTEKHGTHLDLAKYGCAGGSGPFGGDGLKGVLGWASTALPFFPDALCFRLAAPGT